MELISDRNEIER